MRSVFTIMVRLRQGFGATAFALRACRAEARSRPVSEGWWAHQDLNLEPADYEPAALTVELWARRHKYKSQLSSLNSQRQT